MEDATDEQLARKARDGDTEAFGALITRYDAKLMRYGAKFLSDREDVRDLVQDAFVNAYRNIRSFNANERFSPWMYRIAHNVFVSKLRKRAHEPFTLEFDVLAAFPAQDEGASERERAELRALIDKGLAQLPASYREVLVLYYLEELSYQAIADVLHVPVGTVGVRLARAKKKLRAAYTALDIHSYD